MNNEEYNSEKPMSSKKSVLDLTFKGARSFFLKPESYCTIELPSYITFKELLSKTDKFLRKKDLTSLSNKSEKCENVNYTVLSNKDGKYAWRPLQLIHPALYVALVHKITEESNWNCICKRFNDFCKNDKIQCFSLPVVSMSKKKDKEEQVLHWWLSIEQKSIELSLDYDYLLETDISDCYGSIYTHAIAWALHTKEIAKNKRNDNSLIGNVIDNHIKKMQYGQTNGIPQGSVLMDFIAEIILGYVDLQLSEQLQKEEVDDDYFILRYRDDYRIFTNNPLKGEQILKLLTGVTYDLGMKINPSKTKRTNSLIQSSIKADKLEWIVNNKPDKVIIKNHQKYLLIIHNHAKNYPNSGTISRILDEYNRYLRKVKKIGEQPLPLISIIVDIALLCPKAYPFCSGILSKLLNFIKTKEERSQIINKIKMKFDKKPNTGHLQIWLQRITFKLLPDIEYDEPLCKLVVGEDTVIWNNDWISSEELKKAIDNKVIIDENIKNKLSEIIPVEEVAFFTTYSS